MFEIFRTAGRFQWICIGLYALATGFNIQTNVAILFTAPNEIEFYCDDGAESFKNLSTDEQRNLMTSFGRCFRPDLNLSLYTSQDLLNLNASNMNRSRSCDTGFVYDRTYMDFTITEQFDLICERKWFVSMSKSVFMVGYFIGALGSGTVSDRFGRKLTMVLFSGCAAIMNAVLAFPPSAVFFLVFRCIAGAFAIGFYTAGLILQTELMRKEERKLPRTALSFSIDFVIMVFVGVTVGLRDHRFLQTYIACGMFVCCILMAFFIPESPRWLVSQGRHEEARAICKRIAKFNSWKEEDMEHLMVVGEEDNGKKNILDLFRTPVLRKRIILLCVVWIFHIMSFYALIFNLGTFYPDLRIGLVLVNLIELPSTLLPMFLIDFIGRQLSTSVFLGVAGIACLSMGPLLLHGDGKGSIPLLLLAVFGKVMNSRQFFISYIYTQELMPTELRSQGLGVASTVSRIGGMIAPQIILLDDLWPAMSVNILGFTAILAAVVVLALPDTTGEELPQTINDVEHFKTKHKFRPDWPRKRETKLDEVNDAGEMEQMNGKSAETSKENGIIQT